MSNVRDQETLVYEYIERWIKHLDIIEGLSVGNKMESRKDLSLTIKRLEEVLSDDRDAEKHIAKLTDDIVKSYCKLKYLLASGSFLSIEFSTKKWQSIPMVFSDEQGKIKVYRYTDDISLAKFIKKTLKRVDLSEVKVLVSTQNSQKG